METSTAEFPDMTSTSAPMESRTGIDVDAPVASLGKRAREDDGKNLALDPAEPPADDAPKPGGKKKRKRKEGVGQSTA